MGTSFTEKAISAVLVTSCTISQITPIPSLIFAQEMSNLPEGFSSQAIGHTDGLGSADFISLNKSFVINGSGGVIGKDVGVSDSYQFVSYEVEGNATIVARLVNFDMSQAQYGQAGVFIREDVESEASSYFGVYVEPSKNQYRYAYRDTTKGTTGAAAISDLNAESKGKYIKLEKTGSSYRYYIAEDVNFTKIIAEGGQTVTTESDSWYVGFVVSNGGSAASASAVFDNVTIQDGSGKIYESNPKEEIEAPELPELEPERQGYLPEGFIQSKLGVFNEKGYSNFNEEMKSFVIEGYGKALGKDQGVTDDYHFINYEVQGDATITARLEEFDMSQAPNGQVGIMIRNDNTDDQADYMSLYVEPSKGEYRYAYRDTTKGTTGAASLGISSEEKGLYLKILKTGVNYKYYVATDANFINIVAQGGQTIQTESETWNVGFMVSNGNSEYPTVATFNEVKIQTDTGVIYESNPQVTPELPDNSLPPVENILPKGFYSSSIGNNELTGGAIFDKEMKQLMVTGSGTFIGKDTNSMDNYQFINYEVEDDMTITARLVDFDMSQAPYGQAGVFVRGDNETPQADYFGVYVEPSKDQYRYAYRDNENQKSGAAIINGLDKTKKEQYIKIVKKGTSFTTYISADPTFPSDSTIVKSQGISTDNQTWNVGFVVSNGGSQSPATAIFDNIRIETANKVYYDSTLEERPVNTVENLRGLAGDQKVTLTWNPVENAVHYHIKRAEIKDGEYKEIATIESDQTMYLDETVENFKTYYYKVSASNEEGEGYDSQDVIIIPNNSNPLNLQYGSDAAIFTMEVEPQDTVSASNIELAGSINLSGNIHIVKDGQTIVDNLNVEAQELFKQSIELTPGRNEIQLYHTAEDGKRTLKSYNILYLANESYDKIVDASYNGVSGAEVNGIQMYSTITDAVKSVSTKNKERVTIYVKNGVYKEKTIVESPYISIVGEDSEQTIWTYDASNGTINPETGEKYGTSKSASVTIKSKAIGFTAENITIENSYVETNSVEGDQAVALNNQADQSIFVNVRFIGNQDTLLADASSKSPARQYYYNCYIQGDVDFIFGRAQAVFDNCEIASYNRNSNPGVSNGYITAADTWDRDNYGYLIMNSRLIGLDNIREGSVSLGRPWRPSSQTDPITPAVTYVNCYMGEHISTQGWDDMGASLASTSNFFEFASYGPGVHLSSTRPVLNVTEAQEYTMEKVFSKNAAVTLDGKSGYASDWNPLDSTQEVNISGLYKTNFVDIEVTSITLNHQSLNLRVGETETLTASLNPENTTNTMITYESSDSSIINVTQDGKITAITPGTATITAKVGSVSAECVITVLAPNTAPIIEAEDVTLFIGDIFDPMLGVKANDAEDGDLTSNIQIEQNNVNLQKAGTYQVTYLVTDSEGLQTKLIRTIVIKTNEQPIITAQDLTFNVGDSIDLLSSVKATDVEDGDLTDKIIILEHNIDETKAGQYYVIYSVRDSNGNVVTKQINVTLLSNGLPVIHAEDLIIKVKDKFDPKAYATATDVEDGDLTSKIKVKSNKVKTSKPGVYAVTYEVTDSDKNKVQKTIQVTVESNEKPILTASDQVIDINESFDAKSIVKAMDQEDGNITDQVIIRENTVNTSKAGTYKIIYEITDSDGNKVIKEIKVSVYDFENSFTVKEMKVKSSSVSGTGVPGAQVSVYINGEAVDKTVTVSKSGNYKVSIGKQPAGTKLEVKMKTSTGSTISKSIMIVDEFKKFSVSSIKANATELKGKGVEGATIIATVGNEVIGTTRVESDGTFTLNIKSQSKGTKISVEISKTGFITKTKSITVK